MVTLAYMSEHGIIYFERGGIVFRSVKSFDFNSSHCPIRFEGEIFGVTPTKQPLEVFEVAASMQHPNDCVMDIDASIALLKYRVLDNSLISNLRERLWTKKK